MASWKEMWDNYPVGTFWVYRRLEDNMIEYYKNAENKRFYRILQGRIVFESSNIYNLDFDPNDRGWKTELFTLEHLQYLDKHNNWDNNKEIKEFFQEAIEWLIKQHT